MQDWIRLDFFCFVFLVVTKSHEKTNSDNELTLYCLCGKMWHVLIIEELRCCPEHIDDPHSCTGWHFHLLPLTHPLGFVLSVCLSLKLVKRKYDIERYKCNSVEQSYVLFCHHLWTLKIYFLSPWRVLNCPVWKPFHWHTKFVLTGSWIASNKSVVYSPLSLVKSSHVFWEIIQPFLKVKLHICELFAMIKKALFWDCKS